MYNRYFRGALKANGDVEAATENAIQGASTADQKALAILRYIRKNMRGLYSARVTAAERAAIFKRQPKTGLRTSADVLHSGIGSSDELNLLFASMAIEAGLNARPVLVGDREEIAFQPDFTDKYFLRNIDMAVNIDGKWKLLDVNARWLPAGMLSWREEGMQALICDPKHPSFIEWPLAPAEASVSHRVAKLTLSATGAIDGDIDEEFTGHSAGERRAELESDSEPQRLEKLKDEIKSTFSTAVVTAARIEHADDPESPLKIHYHISVPGYAQRTGKRLFIRPLYFQKGEAPLFSASERHYPVHFRYGWTEDDEVEIKFPAGFALDNADQPHGLTFGSPGAYDISMVTVDGGRTLRCKRKFTFGKEGRLFFPAAEYSAVKMVFDQIHLRDVHILALKQTASGDVQ